MHSRKLSSLLLVETTMGAAGVAEKEEVRQACTAICKTRQAKEQRREA